MKQNHHSLFLTCIALLSVSGCVGQPVETHANEHHDRVRAEFNAQTGSQRECADIYVKDYRASLIKDCEATRSGDGITGGCYHIARTITTEVLERSIQHCVKALKGN